VFDERAHAAALMSRYVRMNAAATWGTICYARSLMELQSDNCTANNLCRCFCGRVEGPSCNRSPDTTGWTQQRCFATPCRPLV